ncbi:MAG: hypothetical protein DHS20C18_20540 [Saprospiraceae bacterium]|nr:MAG: hypothetical protein DHS20C18_20540 [Saprospiraceae bacterium]
MSTPPAPARLHILLASHAPVGIVIRRGPAKQVCTLLWDRKKDTFSLGQWLKGRIYERRCDLSPHGKHFLYFAMDARRSREGPPCWTAISRTPWLRAIALYGEEETWLGGGRFLDDQSYSVNGGVFFQTLRESPEIKRKLPDPNLPPRPISELTASPFPITGDLGVYYPRLLREGWTMTEQHKSDRNHTRDIFEKPATGGWILQKVAHSQIGSGKAKGKGVHWDEHNLIHPRNNISIAQPDWEWLDTDGPRLVWATNGQLWTGNLSKTGLKETRLLHDFNDMKFEAIKAPYE